MRNFILKNKMEKERNKKLNGMGRVCGSGKNWGKEGEDQSTLYEIPKELIKIDIKK